MYTPHPRFVVALCVAHCVAHNAALYAAAGAVSTQEPHAPHARKMHLKEVGSYLFHSLFP